MLYSPVRRLDLTNPPKSHRQIPAQLACVKHAASVHPEPGSNSPKNFFFGLQQARLTCLASLHLFPLSRCCRLPFSRAVRRATRGIILSPVTSVYSLFSFTLYHTYFSYCTLWRTFLFRFCDFMALLLTFFSHSLLSFSYSISLKKFSVFFFEKSNDRVFELLTYLKPPKLVIEWLCNHYREEVLW